MADAAGITSIRVASRPVPRAHPCTAREARPGTEPCGATPAMPWQRTCPHGHDRRIWLCGVHATIMLTAPGHCAECLDRGGAVPAIIEPLLQEAP